MIAKYVAKDHADQLTAYKQLLETNPDSAIEFTQDFTAEEKTSKKRMREAEGSRLPFFHLVPTDAQLAIARKNVLYAIKVWLRLVAWHPRETKRINPFEHGYTVCWSWLKTLGVDPENMTLEDAIRLAGEKNGFILPQRA